MILFLFMTNLALGQQNTDREVRYKKETEVDFEGLDVTGQLLKPAGALIQDRERANFNPLIKLKELTSFSKMCFD